MLASAQRFKATQDDIVTVAVASARRAWGRGNVESLAPTLAVLQVRTARTAQAAVAAMVAEQSIDAPAVAPIATQAFRTTSNGEPLASLLTRARSLSVLEVITVTQIADTARLATGVATTARPNLTGYIRNVGATCCSRCAILAGKFYRYSSGFARHPACRCTMVPSNSGAQIETPDDLFRQGRITDLSKADAAAVANGADLSQVVNVRRKQAGLTVAGRVVERGGRLTPAGINRLATDRADEIRLLRKHGYLL